MRLKDPSPTTTTVSSISFSVEVEVTVTMSCFLYQIGQLSTDTLAFHHDVAEFHFDDYQRLLHISGCTLRYIVYSMWLQWLS